MRNPNVLNPSTVFSVMKKINLQNSLSLSFSFCFSLSIHNIYIYIHTYMSMYVYIYVYVYVCIYTQVYKDGSACTYIYIYMRVCIYIYIGRERYNLYSHSLFARSRIFCPDCATIIPEAVDVLEQGILSSRIRPRKAGKRHDRLELALAAPDSADSLGFWG